MKHKCLSVLWCIIATCFCTTVSAQDLVTTKVTPAETEREWTLEINLQNPNEAGYTAFQFNITLPEGFSIKEGSATPSTRLSDHTLMMTQYDPSAYKFAVYSLTNAPISGNSGCVMSVTIVANSSLESGYYTGTLSDILFATQGGKQTHFSDQSLYLNYETSLPTYTATFWVDNEVYYSVECVVGDPIPLPEEPEKEGHTFVDWLNYCQFMPNENINILSVFVVNQYLLTYKLNNRVIHSEYVEYGATIVPYKIYIAEDKVFSGWINLPETMPAHDVVVVGTTTPVGIDTLPTDDAIVDVYTLQGTVVARQVTYAWIKAHLTPGIYIINHTKVIVGNAVEQ